MILPREPTTARAPVHRGDPRRVPDVEPAPEPAPPFSEQLERWLRRDEPKTLGEMTDVFGQKGLAVLVLLLMSVPALPLPTGGVTHVLEAVAILVGLEMILGRKTLWLPRRLRRRELGPLLADRAIPFIIRRVRWFEKRARRRAAWLFSHPLFLRLLGVVIVGFSLASALAPPFSGLDTFPALGTVVVSLAIILEDALVLGIGLLIGAGGIVLIVSVGAAFARLIRDLL
jgi:hypothetical protein